jgi:hypothetical protein
MLRPLFICTAKAKASGPICTAAAPKASEVWRGSRPCTRLLHLRQRQMVISKRRQIVLRYNFLLKLRRDPFHFQFAATVTMCGRGHGDDFIDFLGNGLATVLAVGRTGFASRRLRTEVARTARKWGGLSFGCSLRFLQLLLQLLVFLAQSFLLPFQSFPLSFQSSPFLFPLLPLLTQPVVLSA